MADPHLVVCDFMGRRVGRVLPLNPNGGMTSAARIGQIAVATS
jgi:hypothetical protein